MISIFSLFFWWYSQEAMKYFIFFFSLCCLGNINSRAAEPTFACSHEELCRLAKLIAEEAGTGNILTETLVKISGDPHDFEPAARELKAMINAPVLITGPQELNPWMKKINYQRSKNPALITLSLQLEKSDLKLYPYGTSEALSHFWLYPEIYCRMKAELANLMKQKQFIKKTISPDKCLAEARAIETSLKRALAELAVPVILTHDAILPLLLNLKNPQSVVVAIKGSGHHEEASPAAVKKLYDALNAPKAIWVEESNITVPANIMAKKRKQDIIIKIDTAQTVQHSPFAVLKTLETELTRAGKLL